MAGQRVRPIPDRQSSRVPQEETSHAGAIVTTLQLSRIQPLGNRAAFAFLAFLIAVLSAWTSPAVFAAETPPAWTENAGLILRIHHSAAPDAKATTAAAADEYGEIFDSPDYQSLLLLPSQGTNAYVLTLATMKACSYPRELVIDTQGRVSVPAPEKGSDAGLARTEKDGRLHLTISGAELFVEPAPPLIGPLTREEREAREPAYTRKAHAYKPDPKMVARVKSEPGPVQIIAFFGTWCSTCKEALPALFATLDAAGNAGIELTCVGVDEDLTKPAELISSYEVGETPTFIVLSDGIELGRIAGEVHRSVEADLAAIFDGGGR